MCASSPHRIHCDPNRRTLHWLCREPGTVDEVQARHDLFDGLQPNVVQDIDQPICLKPSDPKVGVADIERTQNEGDTNALEEDDPLRAGLPSVSRGSA